MYVEYSLETSAIRIRRGRLALCAEELGFSLSGRSQTLMRARDNGAREAVEGAKTRHFLTLFKIADNQRVLRCRVFNRLSLSDRSHNSKSVRKCRVLVPPRRPRARMGVCHAPEREIGEGKLERRALNAFFTDTDYCLGGGGCFGDIQQTYSLRSLSAPLFGRRSSRAS